MNDGSGQTLVSRAMVFTIAAAVLFPADVRADVYAFPTADGRIVSVSVPEQCKMKRSEDGRAMICEWQAKDGGDRKVMLKAETVALTDFARQFRIDRAKFIADPDGYMVAILRKMEKVAMEQQPTPGGKRIRADAEIASAARTAKGMDKCLQLDFDWLGQLDDGTKVRADYSGLRCLTFDADTQISNFVTLENTNIHPTDLENRQSDHSREAKRTLNSLQLK